MCRGSVGVSYLAGPTTSRCSDVLGELSDIELCGRIVELAIFLSRSRNRRGPTLLEDLAIHARSTPMIVIEQDAFLAEVEIELIQRALRQAKGNKAQAARTLQISRAKLLRRMEQLGIDA